MMRLSWANRRLGGLFAVLWLGACTTPPAVDEPAVSGYAEPAAADVITVGFDSITEKYIDPVQLDRISIDGLRGLGAIDAGVGLTAENGAVALTDHGIEFARLPMPASNDVRAWATLVATLTDRARQESAQLRAAPAEKIYEAIFDGVLSDLDIFSRYAGSDEASRNRANRDGFGGIGIRFRIEGDAAVITEVLDGTPAAEAGLVVGDKILLVDGQSIGVLTDRDLTRLMRGPVQTQVRLTIGREGAPSPFPLSVERTHIVPQTVTWQAENGIGVIRIASFNQDTGNAVERALGELVHPGAPPLLGLVLDLRGNPGGLLRQSIKVADLLLTQGDILRTVGRHPDSLHHYSASGSDEAAGLPIVVMIDGRSASAAEIVAAALQDRDRAVVIGTASYGKGSVQTVIRLPNDGEITLTWSKFVAPSGYVLHGLGVVPTVCTSGRSDLADAAEVIEGSLATASRADEAHSWRHRALLSAEDRNALRSNCPAQSRPGTYDLEIAKRLLLNKRLHAQALQVTTATAQVSH